MAKKLLAGIIVAMGVALAASDFTVAGIAAWKIVLGIVGLAIFMSARPRPGER